MTKFTAALITMLVAGVVPLGKAVCKDGEVSVSVYRDHPAEPLYRGYIFANDCGIIDQGTEGSCGSYWGGSTVNCDHNGDVTQVKIKGAIWSACYGADNQACGVATLQECCVRQTPYSSE